MSPLLRRRRTADDEAPDLPPKGVDRNDATSDAAPTLETSADAPPTLAQPAVGTHSGAGGEDAPLPAAVPAGLAPEDTIGDPPDTRRRGRLRRRLRHLRRVRELMLRDIGGLVYEIHRTEPAGDPQSPAGAHQQELVRSKLDRLVDLDAERHRLEDTLGDRRPETVLREPGVGGTCPGCGEYFASDARFCSRCGRRVDGHGEPERDAAAAEAGVPT